MHQTDNRYLLIKSWGFGFYSDVIAVLGSLLLAEITHRTPVVHWGKNSLFGSFENFLSRSLLSVSTTFPVKRISFLPNGTVKIWRKKTFRSGAVNTPEWIL